MAGTSCRWTGTTATMTRKPAMPKPERDLAKLETSVVAEALAVLRETTEQEIGRAVRAVHVHVPLEILRRQVCRNCGWPVPCATRRLAERVLRAAGLADLIAKDP